MSNNTISSVSKTDSALPVRTASQYVDSDEVFEQRDATDEEIDALPHVVDAIPSMAWVAMVAGAAERFAYYSMVSVWQNYMSNPRRGFAVPGALNLGQSTATTISNAFFLFQCFMPIWFALLSDMWLGRYKTLVLGLMSYFIGCIVMLVTSLPPVLDRYASAGPAGLAVSMILVGLGVGSIKGAVYPFIADQYTQQKPQIARRANGDLVILDGQRTLQFIYNCFYWFINIGAVISTIGTTMLEKRIDFWASYLMATISLFVTLLCLVVPSRRFVKIPPTSSILPSTFRILVAAATSSWCLDNAKPEYQHARHGRTNVPWSSELVDELKIGLRTCRVFIWLAPLFLSFNQMYNNLVSQASTMETGAFPNDAIPAMAAVACIILGPIVQGLYSMLAARKIAFPAIARITTGFAFSAVGMGLASATQAVIYTRGPCYDSPLQCPASNNGLIPNRISVWLQLPTYVSIALAEIFGLVSVSEYAYNQSPKGMRTVVQALTQLSAMLGAGIGMAISPIARDPNLVWMFGMLAGVVTISAVGFWWMFAEEPNEKGREQNQTEDSTEKLDDGNMESKKEQIDIEVSASRITDHHTIAN